MDEENFEKKSSKKALKIVLLVVLILAIAGAAVYFAFFFNKTKAKPETAVNDVVGQMFDGAEKIKDVKSAKMELEISGSVKATKNSSSDMAAQIGVIGEILKTAKLKTNIAVDVENKIFDGEISIKYQGKDVITAEAIFQDGKLYGYLKDLYKKYIELPIDELDFDTEELEEILKAVKIDEKMGKDIEEIIKAKIENSEIKSEETTVDIAGKSTKVNKSTLTLSVKEIGDVLYDILDKVGEYQTDRTIKEAIADFQEELKDVEETENYLNVEMYTEKSENALVKLDITAVNKEDGEVIVVSAEKSEKTWKITFAMNSDSTDVKGATDMIRAEITEENENEGKISVTVIVEEEGIEVTGNVAYKVEYNTEIEKKNVKNSIKAEDMTEEDFQEILENAEKNEILKSVIDMVMEQFGSKQTVFNELNSIED